MDDDTRKKVCQLIAGIVITDDVLDDREEAFVGRMLQRFGLAETEREVIFPLVDGAEAAATMKTLPADVQAEAFELLVGAACADGEVVPEERKYLAQVAEAIGRPEAEVEAAIAAALASGA